MDLSLSPPANPKAALSAPHHATDLADSRKDTFLDRFAARPGIARYLALTVLCALLYLPGIASIPPTDRDEARFMQATKQMIETGDYVNIRFQNEPRNKKPAGIHWLQTAAVKISGQDLATYWPYRLPSVLAAWFAVVVCCAVGSRMFSPRTGFIAGAVLATSFMVVIEAHIAKTDAMLLAATTVAMGALGLIYANRTRESASWGLVLVFWLSLAAGTLVKGPVSLAVVLATIVALGVADRNVRWLKQTRPLLGFPLALALTLPWLMATSGSEGENNFFVEAVRGDLIPKLIGGQESHGAPPGAHLAAGFITTWPWSLLLPFAVVFAWRHRSEPVIRFCLAWLVSTWALFEVVPTKLPHYTLPAFPALAMLVALTLQSETTHDLMRTLSGRIYRAVWALVTLALAVGIVFAALTYGPEAVTVAIITGVVLALAAVLAMMDWRTTKPLTLAAGAATAFAILLSAGVIPRLSELAVSPRLAAAIAPYRTRSTEPIAIAGYSEPSAVFLLGTETLLTSTASVADFLLRHPGTVGVIEAAQVEPVTRAIADLGGTVRKLDEIAGYNYSRGDPVDLAVITITVPEAQP